MKILEEHIPRLVKHLNVNEIYCWTYNRDGVTKCMVHVHIQNLHNMYAGHDRCQRILSKVDNTQFSYHTTSEVQTKIKDGLGRLHLICQPNNRIYLCPDHRSTISLPHVSVQDLMRQTVEYIKQDKDKIVSFIDGFQWYLSSGNYPYAAFMLHQAMELSCRTAQKVLIGDERKTHSLKQSIDFLKSFDASLVDIYSDSQEEEAINKLTKSYICSRYKQNFQMEMYQIEICKKLVDRVFVRIADYEKELLDEIESTKDSGYPILQDSSVQKIETFKKNNIMEKKTNINHSHRDLILYAFEAFGSVQNLYCFAYTNRQNSMCNLLHIGQNHQENHHYYLYVIMSKHDKPIMDLQNCVQQSLPQMVTVTLIVETSVQVEKKLEKGDVLRTNLLQSAECWYSEKELVVQEQLQFSENLELSRYLWTKRYQNALQLVGIYEGENFYEPSNEITSYMLVLAIEQICLGLIKQFYDFIPLSTNLNYLLDLCDIICPEVTNDFHRDIPEQKLIFNQLIHVQQKFRHSTTFKAKGEHLSELSRRTRSFIKKADDFVQVYVERQTKEEDLKTENIEQCA